MKLTFTQVRRRFPSAGRPGIIVAVAVVILISVGAIVALGAWLGAAAADRAFMLGTPLFLAVFPVSLLVIGSAWTSRPLSVGPALRRATFTTVICTVLFASAWAPWISHSWAVASTVDLDDARATRCDWVAICAAYRCGRLRPAELIGSGERCVAGPLTRIELWGWLGTGPSWTHLYRPDWQVRAVHSGDSTDRAAAIERLRWAGELPEPSRPDPRVLIAWFAAAGATFALFGLACVSVLPPDRRLSPSEAARVLICAAIVVVLAPPSAFLVTGEARAAGVAPGAIVAAGSVAMLLLYAGAWTAVVSTLRRTRFSAWLAAGWPVLTASTAMAPAIWFGVYCLSTPGRISVRALWLTPAACLVTAALLVPAFSRVNEQIKVLPR